jgi:ABC-type branched-subunit amino acid transport system substrate-binding protein
METAFFKMVNDQGGVAGRKINYISLDDGDSPPKTVEQVRRLVEEDQVALLFNTLGTATNSAIQRYVNQKQVPHLFVATGADKFGDYQHFPWTMGFAPSYRTEAQIYAKYILKEKPNAKIAILYQNDDFGKDYLAGMKDLLGDKFDKMVVTASYESTAKLGLADLVKKEPKSAEELAQATDTHAPSLYRVLRALANAGISAEDEDQRFHSTSPAATLQNDLPGSLRFFAMTELGEEHYPAWEHALYSVRPLTLQKFGRPCRDPGLRFGQCRALLLGRVN